MADDDADNDNRDPDRLPPRSARDAFRDQLTSLLIREARKSARKRVHRLRRAGRRLDSEYHHDLVQDVLEDTWRAALRWVPEDQSLLDHVRDVIRQRAFNEARKGPDAHISIQAANDNGWFRMEAEISTAHAARGQLDPVRLASISDQVMTALRRLAAGDAGATAVLECWGAGVTERADVIAQTDLSLPRYRAARERIRYLAQGLPARLRQAVQELLRSDT